MIMTLQEIFSTCPDWDRFCRLHGFNEYAVNEGGGDVQVSLTISQAYHLGIVQQVPDWKLQTFEEAYPGTDRTESERI